VPIGVGKHFFTKWTDEFYYKATRLGTYYDKWAALQALTSNEGFFWRDFSSYFDVGAFSLSYWSGGLQDEMLDLFTGAFQGGTGKFAWRYNTMGSTDSSKYWPAAVVDIYDDETNYNAVMRMPRIEAASSYNLRWYGMVLPMLRYNALFDYTSDFSNYARVCLEGYLDCMEYEDVPTTKYTNPLSGYTYIASNTDRPQYAIGRTCCARRRHTSTTSTRRRAMPWMTW